LFSLICLAKALKKFPSAAHHFHSEYAHAFLFLLWKRKRIDILWATELALRIPPHDFSQLALGLCKFYRGLKRQPKSFLFICGHLQHLIFGQFNFLL